MRSPESNQQLTDTLAKLALEFTASVPARLDAIRVAFDNSRDNDWSAMSVDELNRQVHSLAGAAGTFGEIDLSAGARKVLEALTKLIAEGPPVENGNAEQFNRIIFEFFENSARHP